MNKLLLTFVSIVFCCFVTADKSFVDMSVTSVLADEEPIWTTVKFPSADELAITVDIYEINPEKPYILLCHQAGYSRGEYREIAVKLNHLGFNCMAIDQRSGGTVNGVENETSKGAAKANLGRKYRDAEQDIIAAIDYLYTVAKEPIIIWGSSYSASLVLKIGNKNDKVSAILSFSPGEYIKGTNISQASTGISKPLFVTSSKSEGESVTKLISGVTGDQKVQFIPRGKGLHGSKALWSQSEDNEEYWIAVKAFLNKL